MWIIIFWLYAFTNMSCSGPEKLLISELCLSYGQECYEVSKISPCTEYISLILWRVYLIELRPHLSSFSHMEFPHFLAFFEFDHEIKNMVYILLRNSRCHSFAISNTYRDDLTAKIDNIMENLGFFFLKN